LSGLAKIIIFRNVSAVLYAVYELGQTEHCRISKQKMKVRLFLKIAVN
jgi:hypothetical protein